MRSSGSDKAKRSVGAWRRIIRYARNASIFTVSMVVTHVICLVLFSAIAGLIAEAIGR